MSLVHRRTVFFSVSKPCLGFILSGPYLGLFTLLDSPRSTPGNKWLPLSHLDRSTPFLPQQMGIAYPGEKPPLLWSRASGKTLGCFWNCQLEPRDIRTLEGSVYRDASFFPAVAGILALKTKIEFCRCSVFHLAGENIFFENRFLAGGQNLLFFRFYKKIAVMFFNLFLVWAGGGAVTPFPSQQVFFRLWKKRVTGIPECGSAPQ